MTSSLWMGPGMANRALVLSPEARQQLCDRLRKFAIPGLDMELAADVIEEWYTYGGWACDGSYIRGDTESIDQVEKWHLDATTRLPLVEGRLKAAKARVKELERALMLARGQVIDLKTGWDDGREYPEGLRFYDEGIKAFEDGRPFVIAASKSWRTGWRDARDMAND
jgi:hypothetical protein